MLFCHSFDSPQRRSRSSGTYLWVSKVCVRETDSQIRLDSLATINAIRPPVDQNRIAKP